MGHKPTFDPKDRVQITQASKRGDYYHVEGVTRDGGRAQVEIGARDVEGRSRKEAEALMRRSILGTVQTERGR